MQYAKFLHMSRAIFGLACVVSLSIFLATSGEAPTLSETVHFSSGDTLEIAGHNDSGNTVNLILMNGDTVNFSKDIIDSIDSTVAPLTLRTTPQPTQALDIGSETIPKKPFARLIRAAADRHGVADELLHAVIQVESAYRPDAQSPRGAMGLMQLMPATASRYNVGDPFDPAANIDAGTRYLRLLLDSYGMRGGLAAYNAGEGSVIKFQGVPPYSETRNYVERILKILDESEK